MKIEEINHAHFPYYQHDNPPTFNSKKGYNKRLIMLGTSFTFFGASAAVAGIIAYKKPHLGA